ncbi:MAG: ribonuclease P protein component [Actinomycetaceae bacterium]|nr:ribonuclease P protein component [Actinomycetaceae bacterium]
MLSRENRIGSNKEYFRLAFDGVRKGTSRLRVYIGHMNSSTDLPVKVGFVVSKKVGNSPVRHRVSRQLRHICRSLIDDSLFFSNEVVVIVAYSQAAHQKSHVLEKDIRNALEKIRTHQEKKAHSLMCQPSEEEKR